MKNIKKSLVTKVTKEKDKLYKAQQVALVLRQTESKAQASNFELKANPYPTQIPHNKPIKP